MNETTEKASHTAGFLVDELREMLITDDVALQILSSQMLQDALRIRDTLNRLEGK